ncbi:similar to Saccharomyces cerevisiae YPR186C PZF1 Transcription factor IIIA (TFIIIA) [Geotrichum candidum]|uniref:Similar to Saccharomyces cerevisiae YPR186C PZF1 Transcription factor IIIA (TFIIIA) n=1 Tax=Geotrichum candidum TaxID=1173061 RepID=A0A0J9XHN4_GEOCN|nr:similar to Saccharomyces cerevisiae YPR186C PZF1 Transcription factor IIIA (TFIIIA) [Geotrichum candidum]
MNSFQMAETFGSPQHELPPSNLMFFQNMGNNQHPTTLPPPSSVTSAPAPVAPVAGSTLADAADAKKNARKPKPRPKKYLCPELNCDKAYSRPCLLQQHLRSHADERPYVCTHPGCGKAFLRDSHLKTHMLSHSVEKPLYCTYCGKGFNTNQHLNRHERTHVPSIKCTYEGCNSAFRRNSQLRRHISECHTFRKQFVCPSCPREFDVKSRLDTHFAKSHGGTSAATNATVPPPGISVTSGFSAPVGLNHNAYHCGSEGCNEKFSSWPDLQGHIKFAHKQLGCNFCGKLFNTPEALDLHVKEHDMENSHLLTHEWHCRECDNTSMASTFREKDSLISHYQQYHGFVPDTLQVQVQTPASADCLPPLSAITESKQQQFLQTLPQQQATQSLPHLPYNLPYNGHLAPPQQQQLPTVREPLFKGHSIIDRITGSNYDAHRRIECPVEGCGFRFAREYDMKRHAKAVHPHVAIDDILAISRVSSEASAAAAAAAAAAQNNNNNNNTNNSSNANSPHIANNTSHLVNNTNNHPVSDVGNNHYNAAMPKFRFYMPPSNLTPHSDLSPASNHPPSSSSSPASFQVKQEEVEDHQQNQQHQQQLPSLSQFQQQHQQHQQNHHSHHHQPNPGHGSGLPSFDPALNLSGSPNGFDYLSSHDLSSLGGFHSVQMSHELLHEQNSANHHHHQHAQQQHHHQQNGFQQHYGQQRQPQLPQQQQHSGSNTARPSPQPAQPQQQKGDFERIDPMIVNGSV